MARASPIRTSFNAGELSPLLAGRVDISKYNNGGGICENFIPSVQGPAVRRAGTRYVTEIKSSSNRTWLATFEFNVNQSYVLEFGDRYIRFFTSQAQLGCGTPAAYRTAATVTLTIASPCVITWSAHGLANGDRVVFTTTGALPTGLTAGTAYFVVNATTNTFEVAATADGTAINTSGTQSGTHTANRYYTIGDLVQLSSINYYCIADHSGFPPPNTSYWYALTSDIYEIPTPYLVADLTDTTDGTFMLDMVQTGDVIYIAHKNYPTYKLSRYGVTRWILSQVTFKNGPFKDQNTDQTITVYASAATGTVTLTASKSLFTSSMVGSVFYLEPKDLSTIKPWAAGQEFKTNPVNTYRRSDGKTYQCATNGTPSSGKVWRTGGDTPIHTYGTQADGDGNPKEGTVVEREGLDWTFVDRGAGYVTITAYTSSTQVTATVSGDYPLPQGVIGSGNSTFRWATASFSAIEGYPSKVTFFRERLTLAKGQQLYFSVSGDFENFARTDTSGNVVADRAIQLTLTSDQTNRIEWLIPTQALLVGTAGAEFSCGENSSSEAFAPANVKVEQQTSEGSRSVKPVRVNFSALFVQRSGRKLKEVYYNFQQNGYVTADMTVLAEHVTLGGLQQLAWHKEPYVAAWAVRGEGTLVGFTFNKEQDVVGWHRHILGGAFAGGQAMVESVAVIPSPNKDRDDLWMIVKRTINGQTKRFVEWLEREYRTGDAQSGCFYVDAGVTKSNPPNTSTVTGLSYLEGQTVQVLVNGAAHPDRVVTSGQITLQSTHASLTRTVQIGLGCPATLQTNRIEAGAQDGTSQGKTKRVNKVVMRFHNTLGGFAGPDASNLDELQFRSSADPMNLPPPLFTGDMLIEWPNGYDFDGFIMVRQVQPLPMTLVALMPQLDTFDRR